MYFHVKQYLETLLQPYQIIFPSFCVLQMCYQILYAIIQTSWKEIGENLTNKILFLIMDHMNVILDIHVPYKKVKYIMVQTKTLDNSGTPVIYIC